MREQIKKNTPDLQGRNFLVEEYMEDVKLIAHSFVRRGVPVSLEELTSMGYLGLIDAVDSFDPSRNTGLKTYVELKVKNAILDGLRKLDFLPDKLRRLKKRADNEFFKFYQLHGRTPEEEEMATSLGISLATYKKDVQPILNGNFNLFSMEDSREDEERGEVRLYKDLVDKTEVSPEGAVITSEQSRIFSKAVSSIPGAWGRVLKYYYFNNLNLKQIAEMENLDTTRISQIKKEALERLRSALKRSSFSRLTSL